MGEERQFKIVVFIFWVIAAVSIPFIAIQGYEVIAEVNNKYPDLGLTGWLITVAWVSGAFLLIAVTRKLCRKKKWAKTCNNEGFAAGMLYIFISAVIFIFISG